MGRKTYLSITAALATAVAVWLCALLAAPIAKPLAWALIIGIATLPHHDRLAKRLPAHPDRAAGLMVLVITVCFILPVAAIVVSVAENAAEWYSEGQRLVLAFSTSGSGTLAHLPYAQKLPSLVDRFNIDLTGIGTNLANSASGYLVEVTTTTAKNIGELLFTLALALFILYFIYRDGERMVAVAVNRFSTNPDTAHHYFDEIRATTTAVTVGTAYLTAGLLVLWCTIFVGLTDNAIRPLAIGSKSNIPTLAIVLGAICGVMALGILGLILGPVIFSILFTIWRDITETEGPET